MIVDTNWFPELQDKYLRGWQIKAAAIVISFFWFPSVLSICVIFSRNVDALLL